MIYFYARVSTDKQNVDRQMDIFNEYLKNNPVKKDNSKIAIDKYSGKDFSRPKYKKLKSLIKSGDTLIITSLDRFGRNYSQIIEEWQWMRKKGVDIMVLDMPILNTNNNLNGIDGRFISDLVLQILSYVAEKERDNIKSRQRQGIDAAMARGVRFGRPKKEFNEDAIKNYVMNGKHNYEEYLKQSGVCRSSFFRLVKEREKAYGNI